MLRAQEITSTIQISKEAILRLSIICFPQEKSRTGWRTADRRARIIKNASIFSSNPQKPRNRGSYESDEQCRLAAGGEVPACPENSCESKSGLTISALNARQELTKNAFGKHGIRKPPLFGYYQAKTEINQDTSVHLFTGRVESAATGCSVAHMAADHSERDTGSPSYVRNTTPICAAQTNDVELT